jgi:tetratricopeptide (TPR) repeat protein
MRLTDHATGIEAFQRVIALEPANGEAYSNLAAIFSATDRAADAFKCLKHGVRIAYDNWKVWDNLLTLALHLEDWAEAMAALDRLLDLQALKESVDLVDCVCRLVHGLLSNNASHGTARRALALVQKCLAIASVVEVFDCEALLHFSLDDVPNVNGASAFGLMPSISNQDERHTVPVNLMSKRQKQLSNSAGIQ